METENYSLRNNRKSRALFLGASLALVAVVWLPAGLIDHTPTVCLWCLVGLGPCPGCGMTRAVWHLLHLQFATAWQFNHLIVAVAPVLAGLYLKLGYETFTGKKPQLKFLEKELF